MMVTLNQTDTNIVLVTTTGNEMKSSVCFTCWWLRRDAAAASSVRGTYAKVVLM